MAKQKEKDEQRAWDMWVTLYPYTVIVPYGYKKPLKFIPFSEFLKKTKLPKQVKADKTMDDIIKRAEEIKESDKKNRNA